MSNGIGKNPLTDISRVYLEQIAESGVGYEPGKPATKLGAVTGIPKADQMSAAERIKKKTAEKRAALEKKHGKKMDDHPEYPKKKYVDEADMSGAPSIKDAKLVKKIDVKYDPHMKVMAPVVKKEALDPVGQEDGDVDNDGDKDKSDKYLMKRRKAITKAMKTRKEEVKLETESVVDNPEHAASFKKSADEYAKKLQKRKKVSTEGFSDWRSDLVETDLIEVMDEDEADKPIKEKKVNNKIKINPKLGEAIEEIGGTLIEESEIDEVIESIYIELIEEGYSEDDVEEAIEFALIEELEEGYYDSAVSASKKNAAALRRKEMMKKAKGRLRFMKRKAGEVASNLKKKAANKAVDVAFAGSAAKDKVKTALSTAKKRVSDAPKVAKQGIKDRIKKAALGVAKRMSEDVEVEETKIDEKINPLLKGILKKTPKGEDPKKGGVPYKLTGKMSEEMSVKQQMEFSKKYNRMSPEEKKKLLNKTKAPKVAPKKDTRTSSEKMADAYASPRKGPGGAVRAD